MTMQTEPEDSPRRMTCVRRLYVMEDEAGRTWLAAEEATGNPAEGGAMSHLVPGDTTEVEGDQLDQVTVLVPPHPGGMPHRIQAYRVSPSLLPTGADPATT